MRITNCSRINGKNLLFLYVFSVPFFNYIGFNWLCNTIFVICFLLFSLKRKIAFDKFIIIMALFPFVTFLSATLTGLNWYSLKMIYSVFSMLIAIIMMNSFLTYKDVINIENAVIYGSLSLAAYDFILYMVRGLGVEFRLGDYTANTNNLGIALAFSAIFLFGRIGNDKRSYIGVVIIEILILLTQSRSSLLVSLTGMLILWILKENKLRSLSDPKAILGVLVTASGIFIGQKTGFLERYTQRFTVILTEFRSNNVNQGSVSIRKYLKEIGIRAFWEKPFFGHGIGATRDYFGGAYLHDNYVELLFEVGVIGLIVFLIPIIYFLIKSSVYKEKMVFALMVCVLLEGAFDVYYHNKLYYILFGICILRLKSGINQENMLGEYWNTTSKRKGLVNYGAVR